MSHMSSVGVSASMATSIQPPKVQPFSYQEREDSLALVGVHARRRVDDQAQVLPGEQNEDRGAKKLQHLHRHQRHLHAGSAHRRKADILVALHATTLLLDKRASLTEDAAAVDGD